MEDYIQTFDKFNESNMQNIIAEMNNTNFNFEDLTILQNVSYVPNCTKYGLTGVDAIVCELGTASDEPFDNDTFFEVSIVAAKKFNELCEMNGYTDDIAVIFVDKDRDYTYLKIVRNCGISRYRFKSKLTLSGWFDINNERALMMISYTLSRDY